MWYLVIYVIGAYLSFLRFRASVWSNKIQRIDDDLMYFLSFFVFTSWIGFLIGLYSYFKYDEEYFL